MSALSLLASLAGIGPASRGEQVANCTDAPHCPAAVGSEGSGVTTGTRVGAENTTWRKRRKQEVHNCCQCELQITCTQGNV